jgi:broad specificity phosphatase PhoE
MIYYVRHGESQANESGILAGKQQNPGLSEQGRIQAYRAGENLKQLGISFDRIVASPMLRARQTAEIIAGVIGFDPTKIIFDERLMEYDVGDLSGKSKLGLTSRQIVSAPHAEGPQAFQKRVLEALREHEKGNGNTLIVGHNFFYCMIQASRLGSNLQDFYDVPGLSNAKAVKLDLDWLH